MAPKYERLRMLMTALEAAAHDLDEPIDRLEVKGGEVIVSAKGRRAAYAYRHDDSYDAEGNPLLGGGSWSVSRVR